MEAATVEVRGGAGGRGDWQSSFVFAGSSVLGGGEVEEWAWALGGGVVAGCDRRQRRRRETSVSVEEGGAVCVAAASETVVCRRLMPALTQLVCEVEVLQRW
jgi:hypothetical protein